ncbi:hypothetical protein Q5H93_06875 [Hymenobacter sp. ASUV-10]|uniref:Discoidin domain-containing protein n=1 Tax=Hymenobacter aranciens TaxID=3063996 RepID=A0ABT9B9P5_9BACT|nr:hypothetical protein [Hymenobacter sp. ASUV-10]MDO7874449.1 hypothetical protein [Hymenobacter sp. ASUV-10]
MPKTDFYPQNLAPLLKWLQLQVTQWEANYLKFGYTKDDKDDVVKRVQAVIDRINQVAALQANQAQQVQDRETLTTEFEAYYRELIQRVRRTPKLDAGVPAAFEWDGKEQSKEDADTAQPRVSGVHTAPSEVIIDWVRGRFDGVDVELSYDGSTWTKGDFDTRSPFEDRRPLRTPGQPETRYYRLRYRLKDQPFGQYSKVAQAVARDN